MKLTAELFPISNRYSVVFDGDVVDLRDVCRNVKDYETGNVGTDGLVFDFGDEAGSEAIVIQQTIVAIDGPVRQMMPRPLDIDNAVDVAFADFTNSDVQCLQEQSPRPSCAHITAPAARCLA